jgi:hypothetical protein
VSRYIHIRTDNSGRREYIHLPLRREGTQVFDVHVALVNRCTSDFAMMKVSTEDGSSKSNKINFDQPFRKIH